LDMKIARIKRGKLSIRAFRFLWEEKEVRTCKVPNILL